MLQETKRKIRFFLLIVLSIAFVCFAVLNRQFIRVSLFPLPYSAEMPEFVFAVICFALGIIIGSGFISLKLSRLNRLLKKEHKHVMALQNEIRAVRIENSERLPSIVQSK